VSDALSGRKFLANRCCSQGGERSDCSNGKDCPREFVSPNFGMRIRTPHRPQRGFAPSGDQFVPWLAPIFGISSSAFMAFRSLGLLSAALLFIAGCTSSPDADQPNDASAEDDSPTGVYDKADWSYAGDTGPTQWAELSPAYAACAGERQSPIDLSDATTADGPSLGQAYAPTAAEVVDTGHGLQVNTGGGTLTVDGVTYDLIQFHVHTPSGSYRQHIGPLYYQLVSSGDFYSQVYRELQENPQIEFRFEKVLALEDLDQGAKVLTEEGQYQGSYVFNSINFPIQQQQSRNIYLAQHFYGWFLEMENEVFDPEQMTLMDFRVLQGNEVRFVYLRHFTGRKRSDPHDQSSI